MRSLLSLCVLALFVTLARGDDSQSDRDRAARAALALAAGNKPATIAAAPAPHAKLPKDYPAGHKQAIDTQQPLVVFVACEMRSVDGAVACKCDAPTFGAVTGPAVVVGYPVGDRLMIDATLKGEPKPEVVQRAVKDAARKIDLPPAKAMPLPKPLDWQILADAPAYLPDLPELAVADRSADAYPPVGTVVIAKDTGKAMEHRGNGLFVEVAMPQKTPAAKDGCACGDSCKCPAGVCPACPATATAGRGGNVALAAVNVKRAARGLPPYQFDPALTAAAEACATHRAQRGIFGHITGGMGDFAFLPPGARADATGCAAYPASYGFMACAVYDSYRYAGAAMVPGSDGKVYCHLFVSNSPGGSVGYVAPSPAPLAGSVAPQVYVPPQSSGGSCPNGQCGVPQSQPRYFRR
jgi:hypothetical protein